MKVNNNLSNKHAYNNLSFGSNVAQRIVVNAAFCAAGLLPMASSSNNNLPEKTVVKETQTTKIIPKVITPVVYKEVRNAKLISKDVGWADNIRVLTACTQNAEKSVNSFESYAVKVLDKLKQKDINTIEQANDSLSKNGYTIRNKRYYSLATPGAELGIFSTKDVKNDRFVQKLFPKNDFTKNIYKDKQRFVIIFSQDSVNVTKALTNNAASFYKKIKNDFDIPQENMIKIMVKSKKDFNGGLDSVINKISQLKNKEDAELLIFFNSHGVLIRAKDTININQINQTEGARDGFIFGFLREPTAKKIFNERLKGIKTLLLIDCCHSGAWIADNSNTESHSMLDSNLKSRVGLPTHRQKAGYALNATRYKQAAKKTLRLFA